MARRFACAGFIAVVASMWIGLFGCYTPPKPECGFLCGPAGECPEEYTCAGDHHCHLNGTSGSCARDAAVSRDMPTLTATLTLDRHAVAIGAALDLNGANFGANESVSLTIGNQPVAVATASAAGDFSVIRTVPVGASQGATNASATGATTSKMAFASLTLMRQCGTTTDKCVFVTSVTANGNLGGLAGADSICTTRATAVGLVGTFKAWLSTATVTANSRMTAAALPYVRVDGVTVAATYADLTSVALVQSISISELRAGSLSNVWTDTATNGTSSGANDCAGWTSGGNADSGATGSAQLATAGWTANADTSCDQLAALYCIEQ